MLRIDLNWSLTWAQLVGSLEVTAVETYFPFYVFYQDRQFYFTLMPKPLLLPASIWPYFNSLGNMSPREVIRRDQNNLNVELTDPTVRGNTSPPLILLFYIVLNVLRVKKLYILYIALQSCMHKNSLMQFSACMCWEKMSLILHTSAFCTCEQTTEKRV